MTTIASLRSSQLVASEIDGGCMQTASASSKCPRSHVKAGILAAMKIPPENTRAANTPSRLISETIASERSLERLTKGQVPPQSSSTSVSPGWTF